MYDFHFTRCLRYCKCTSFQANHNTHAARMTCAPVVCDTANVRVFKQITTQLCRPPIQTTLFAILQMYEFSSKSQQILENIFQLKSCLRYCKCTSFQANHNKVQMNKYNKDVVCDTANVRVFKRITTCWAVTSRVTGCLRYCKCTSFQANHNDPFVVKQGRGVVCDTANVRVFKQITTKMIKLITAMSLFAILQKYDFSSKSQRELARPTSRHSCLRYCKCTSFQANHNAVPYRRLHNLLFAILQMYEFSSKQRLKVW